jgi:flagellar biosynthesis protein FlhA
MADAARLSVHKRILGSVSDIAIAGAVVSVVMMIIIPLPTILLDILMAMNLTIALLILLIVLYTQKATDFSLFPMILLVVTVFGLALNISSTRLILSQGARFNGRMIRAFSSFVVGSGGSEGLVVGLIIFIVIIAVQAIVITKGASRVSEVAARFTLDSLPGKQMAIEAEVQSQSITEEEATRKKKELQQESDFYGAMDGASKFISGNVVVGILITAINVIGGIVVGTLFNGEPLLQAVGTYVSFSIGDGILSQFPSLLVSTAMGVVVTRSASSGDLLGRQLSIQFSRDARVYWICAGFLLLLSVLPGFPWYVLIPMAFLVGYYAFTLGRKKQALSAGEAAAASAAAAKGQSPKEEPVEIAPLSPLDPLSLELGYSLVPLVDKDRGAELLERIKMIRRETALSLGLVIPQVRIVDNMRLDGAEYCFKIRGAEVGRGRLRLNFYLGINPGNVTQEISGEKTVDPAFGLPAVWIAEDRRAEAERSGYTVVDSSSIIATHLTELIKHHAAEILGRQEVQAMLEALKKDYPVVVEEVLQTPQGLSMGDIQKVLQSLLREQASIRNMVAIIETLADYAPSTKNVQFLTEKARQALGRELCLQYTDEEDRVLRVLTIEQHFEQKIIDSQVNQSGTMISALDPPSQRLWIGALSRAVQTVEEKGWLPVILCSEQARSLVKSSIERQLPNVAVLSMLELVQDISVEVIGEIRVE